MGKNGIMMEKAKAFIYSHARLLDRKRFNYHFEGGNREDVLLVLKGYQNADGGFGNALEADIRCPGSQTIATEQALLTMDEIGWFDAEMLHGLIRFLTGICRDSGGYPRTLLSINGYPHQPWWTTEQEGPASLNPTGRIAGLLLKQTIVPLVGAETSTPYAQSFTQTLEYIWSSINELQKADYHELIQVITFLEHTHDQSRAQRFRSKLDQMLLEPGVIEYNATAEGYVHKILDYAPTPDSYCAKFFHPTVIEEHLDAMCEEQQEDGGWPINWKALSVGAEAEWRGHVTVNRLLTLKEYGRL